MNAEQLTFFEKTDHELLNEKIEKLETRADNVRKGVFAKYTSQAKMIDALKAQLEEMQAQIHMLAQFLK
jgi:hypothetical protein